MSLTMAVVLACGCASMPVYTGTFIGRTDRAETRSRNGERFSVTVFTVETTKGEIELSGFGRGLGPHQIWRRVFLVDRHYIAHPPEKFAGKRLEIEGRADLHTFRPFRGGPELSEVPDRRHVDVVIYNVLIVCKMRIDDVPVVEPTRSLK